jgi:hypothetical protein
MVAVSVKLCHVSMQFSDSLLQHKEDAQAVFNYASKHNSWFVTGTEAGMTHNNHDLHDDLVAAAHRYNFAIYANRWGEWIGGNRKFLETFDRGYEGPYIRGTHGLTAEEGGHSPRGITWMSAHSKKYPKLGELTVGVLAFSHTEVHADFGVEPAPYRGDWQVRQVPRLRWKQVFLLRRRQYAR